MIADETCDEKPNESCSFLLLNHTEEEDTVLDDNIRNGEEVVVAVNGKANGVNGKVSVGVYQR